MTKKISYILLLILFIPAILRSNNREDSLYVTTETIKVSSNRIETDFYNSPSSVFLMDKSSINKTNGEKLSDALQTVGGIFIKSYGNNSSLKTLSINGLGSENVLILYNGMRLNSNQNAQYDLSLISKSDIDNIEISYNGLSAAYGSEAVSGILSINTRDINNNSNNSNSVNFNIKADLGSYNFKRLSSFIDLTHNKISGRLSFSSESSDDDFHYFSESNNREIKTRENSSYNYKSVTASVNYDISKLSKINLYSNYILNKRQIPGVITAVYPSDNRQEDKNLNTVLNYNHKLSVNKSIDMLLSFQNNLMNYISPGIENSYYKNISVNTNLSFNHYSDFLCYKAGVDIIKAGIVSNNLKSNAERIQIASYLSSEVKLNSVIKLFPSVRIENFSDINDLILSGRIGVNIKPIKKENFHIRSTIGNNFRAPTFNELYWVYGGNPELKPEKSYNIDAGLIYSFYAFFKNTVEVKYTHIESFDKILWKPLNEIIWSPQNISSALSNNYSVSINLNKFLKDYEVSLYADYTRTASRKNNEDFEDDPSYGKQLPYIPIESSKINLNFSYKIIGFNLFYSFLGKRFINSDNSVFLPGVDIFDGNIFLKFSFLNYEIIPRFEVNNIFNTDYQIIAGYPVPLRNFKLSIQINN